MLTIQLERFGKRNDALFQTIPRQTPWEIDDRTTSLKELHKGRSVIYGIRQHHGYKATEEDIFKFGCADDFNARFESYREAQSAVLVMDTPFPRAAEAIVSHTLRDCKVHAKETAKVRYETLRDVMVHAVRSVDAIVAAMGHTPPTTTHRAYDRKLRRFLKQYFDSKSQSPIASPEDTPLDPKDCVAKAKVEAKRKLGEEKVAKRKRGEEERELKRKRGEEVKRQRGNALASFVGSFLEDDCVRDPHAAWGKRYNHGMAEYVSTLYGEPGCGYIDWCQRNLAKPMKCGEFGESLTLLFGKTNSTWLRLGDKRGRAYLGVRLKTDQEKQGVEQPMECDK